MLLLGHNTAIMWRHFTKSDGNLN